MRVVLLIQKHLILCRWTFLPANWILLRQGFPKRVNAFWAPLAENLGGGREWCSGEEDESCSWANRARIVPPAASALQPRPGASLRTQPTSSWRLHALFTQVSSLPREAQALQTCVTTCFQEMDAHICRLPRGETEAHNGAGEAFGLSKPRRGARRAGRCWVPTGLSGYQAAFVLSNLLLTGIKPLDFSLPETAAAFHLPLGAEAGAPGLSGEGAGPVTLSHTCSGSSASSGRGAGVEGGLELGKHCHILEKCPLALLIPIPLYSYTSPLPTPVSPGKQTEKPKEKSSLFIYFCLFFFFFQLPNFNCSQLQCPRFFTGYIVRNWKEWKNQRGKEIKKTYHILKNGQDQIVASRQVKLVLKL